MNLARVLTVASLLALACCTAWADEDGADPFEDVPEIPAGAPQPPPEKRIERDPALDALSEKVLADKIRRDVQNLGSSFAEVADAAEAELVAIGLPAAEALEKAGENSNPEIVSRAARAFKRLPKATHKVLDANGGTIVGGTIEFHRGERTLVVRPNAQGYISIEGEPHKILSIVVRFCHPDYGCCQAAITVPDEAREFVVPLARRGTPAGNRSLHGVLLGPEGQPIAGQLIRCGGIHTNINLNMVTPTPSLWMLTDEKGRFAYYPPIKSEARARRQILPDGCDFDVVVVAADQSLFPYAGKLSNRTEATIQLERPARFHRFKFEKPGGGFYPDQEKAERDKLAELPVQYERVRGSGELRLDKKLIAEGGKLPPGTYKIAPGVSLTFLPVEAKDDGPEELVFRLLPTLVLTGKVVDGVSGKPIPKALVMTYGSIGDLTVGDLKPDAWKVLRDYPLKHLGQHPLMETFSRIYRMHSLSRTNEAGDFRVEVHPGQNVHALVAIAEDYLPLQQRWESTAIDGQMHADVADLPLFPAALVQFTLKSQTGGSLLHDWKLAPDDQPEWLPKFCAAEEGPRRFERDHPTFVNTLRRLYVPADVGLALEFRAAYGQNLVAAAVPALPKLKQGEIRDLGEIPVRQLPKATVKVVDAAGAAVKRADVRRVYQDGAADVPHPTDDQGETAFFVRPQSSGRFWVEVPTGSGASDAPNLSAAFEIGDDAPTEPYKITLSEAQVQALSKPPVKAE